jgi:hypothetical protein
MALGRPWLVAMITRSIRDFLAMLIAVGGVKRAAHVAAFMARHALSAGQRSQAVA